VNYRQMPIVGTPFFSENVFLKNMFWQPLSKFLEVRLNSESSVEKVQLTIFIPICKGLKKYFAAGV
jgi:hypothetical protein